MSSKKILAASLAAMLAVSSASVMAFAEDAANDDYTYTWTLGKYTREITESAELKVVGDEMHFDAGDDWGAGLIKDASVQAPAYENGNATNKIKLGIWEAFKNFNITEMKSGKITAEAWGKVQDWEEPYVLQVTQDNGVFGYAYVPYSQSNLGKQTGYTPLVPKLKDGKKLVLNNSNFKNDAAATSTAGNLTAGTGAIGSILINSFDTKTDGTDIYFEVSELKDMFTEATTAGTDATVLTATPFFVWDGTSKPTDGHALDAAGAATDGTNAPKPGDAADTGYIMTEAGKGGLTAVVAGDFTQADTWRYGATSIFTGAYNVDNPKKTVELSKEWNKASGNLGSGFYPGTEGFEEGMATAPVTVELTIPTSRTSTLVQFQGVKFYADIDMVVDGKTYDNFVVNKYAIANQDIWAWTGNTGSYGNASANAFRDQYLNSGALTWGAGLGFVAQNADAAAKKGATSIAAVLSAEPTVTKTDEDLFLTNRGTLKVDFGTSVSPEFMKNFNNGGTVTFNLSADASPLNYLTGYVLYWNNNLRVPLEGANAGYTVSGNSITFTAPAGLSYDAGTTNTWKPFNIQWVLEPNTYVSDNTNFVGMWDNGIIIDSNGNIATPTLPDLPELRIESITFKANSTAPADEGNNNNSGSNSGSNGGGSTTNPGSTGNPNTGIALAVAPVVLAAGAVATVVAKKRK